MELYYIRHAQSSNNALWDETGASKGRSEDPVLTELGLQQAQVLAQFLKTGHPRGGHVCNGSPEGGFGLTHLYTSLMVRAVHTGSFVSEALDLPLHGWEELHERGGIYLEDAETGSIDCLPGKDRAYFASHFPRLVLPEGAYEHGWWNRRPREDDQTCLERARRFVAGLLEKHGGTPDRVAVISHGGFFIDFLTALTGLPAPHKVWFLMNNTGISRFDFKQQETDLVYQNRIDHLPHGWIS